MYSVWVWNRWAQNLLVRAGTHGTQLDTTFTVNSLRCATANLACETPPEMSPVVDWLGNRLEVVPAGNGGVGMGA